MRSAFALRIFSGKYISNFGVLKSLRTFQNPFFTEGVWNEPSQALPRQIPPFVTYGDIFPRSGGSLSSQGEPSR